MQALLGAFASVLLVVALAAAADDKSGHSSETQRNTECATQAGARHLTGDARKQFMSDCLKGNTAMRADTSSAADRESHSGTPADGDHHTSQTEKMKTCNHEASAKNLHGDERKTFMSRCLKADKKS